MAHYLIFDLDTFRPLREIILTLKKYIRLNGLEIEAFFL